MTLPFKSSYYLKEKKNLQTKMHRWQLKWQLDGTKISLIYERQKHNCVRIELVKQWIEYNRRAVIIESLYVERTVPKIVKFFKALAKVNDLRYCPYDRLTRNPRKTHSCRRWRFNTKHGNLKKISHKCFFLFWDLDPEINDHFGHGCNSHQSDLL